ncbi:MAG: hypothetical protein MJZ32_10920 [Bacteroidaceae bacterium]|nr:hypothetical protein [Bacteroidaceae bacterium]
MKNNNSFNSIIGTLVPGTVAIYVPTNYDSNREKELVESTLSLFEKSYSNYDKHFPLTVEVRKTDDSSLIDKAFARRVNIGSLYKENYVSATITNDGKWVKAFLDKLYDISSLEDIPVYEVELKVQEALIKADEENARQQAEIDLLVQNAMIEVEEEKACQQAEIDLLVQNAMMEVEEEKARQQAEIDLMIMDAEDEKARQQAEIDAMIQQAIIDRELDLYEQEEEALANLEIELAIREAEAEEKLQEYLDELAIKDAEEEEKLQEYLDELAIKDAEEEEKLQEYLDELAIKDAEEEEIFQEKLDLEYEKVLELQAEQDPISQEDAQRIFGHLLRPTKQEASKPTTKSDDCLKQIVQDYREAKSFESERQELLDNISALIVDYVTRTHDVLPQEEVLNVIKGKIVLSEDTLSSIVVNKDKRIILPDYNELELKLRPIPKTLYLLFLKHPEGIILKNIPDYKDELRHIYLYEVNPNRDDDVLERSLDKLCDPMDNAALRYNITIIKKAVESKIINNKLAMHYYISGRKGEEYRIPLSRDKVRFA